MLTPLHPHQSGKILANSLSLYYETFGDPQNPSVLLIMGVSCPSLQWFPYFIDPIVQQGYYVIRFDNRDVGLSDWIDDPDWQKSPYSLEDMAQDTVGLLDALKIDKAHIIGVSMGGAIAQRIAISHPNKILTLTAIASFGNLSALGTGSIPPNFLTQVPSLEEYLAFWSILAGTTFPLDISLYSKLYRENVEVRKGYNPHSMTHHLNAIARSPSRMTELPKITAPTLVFHGTTDPLIPINHAIAYANLILSAKFVEMKGVGHDIPEGICPIIHTQIFTLFTSIERRPKPMSEITPAKKQFLAYLDAFNKLDPSLIPPFFYLPSLLITSTIVTPPMTTTAEVKGVFTPFMASLEKQGFSKSELKSLSEKQLSKNITIFSGSAVRYKKEGENETELEKLGFTYTLRLDEKDKTWKIIAGIIHDFDTAIAL